MKLIENMSVEELEKQIDSHDCKLNDDGMCNCLFWKQVLLKKKLKANKVGSRWEEQDWLKRNDREAYL